MLPSLPNSLNALQPQRQVLVGVGRLLRLARQLELCRVCLLHLQNLTRLVTSLRLAAIRCIVRGNAQKSVEPSDHVGIVLQLLENNCFSDFFQSLTIVLFLLLHTFAAQVKKNFEGVREVDSEQKAVIQKAHEYLAVANLRNGRFDLFYAVISKFQKYP